MSTKDIKLRDQLLYVIANESLDFQEYYLPCSYYKESHIEAYQEFLSENPELNLGFKIDRSLPEQMNKEGMVVCHGLGPIGEKWRHYFYDFDYSGGILLPKDFHSIQKQKLRQKMKELEQMYLELIYYENGKKIAYYNNMGENPEYKVYQKLKSLVR